MFRLKEKIYKSLFIAGDKIKQLAGWLKRLCHAVFILTSVYFIIVLIFYTGFPQSEYVITNPANTFRSLFFILFFSKFIAEVLKITRRKLIFWIVDGILLFWGLILLLAGISASDSVSVLLHYMTSSYSYISISALLILSKINKVSEFIYSIRIPPSLLFALSFLFVILAGSGLLMLPRAHTQPLYFLDALFTSTSAVCVTGLIVVDTSTAFTLIGKTVIVCLIQFGGLGIMAFTLFFSFIFTGSFSFRDNMVLKDIFSSEKMGGMLKILLKIMGLTFLIELIGAIFIWYSVSEVPDGKVFFSLFHSVSSFCNAGFSTLQNNLYEPGFSDNRIMSLTIASLIILGGMGFPVLLFLFTQFYRFIRRFITKMTGLKKFPKELLVDLNTRVVLLTTFVFLVGGTCLYYLFERNTSLAGLSGTQKGIVAFFGSVSARTAGFNISDLTAWSYPTVFIMIFLMWVGASPGSTGGGIKTTTFAVAMKTAFSFIRGKETVEIGHREIGMNTIIRALSVIILSILIIGAGFIGLLLSDPGRNPAHLLFETVSAYGTVGLSIANSATISSTGKIILICLMFIGRIGPLTLLSALFIRYKRIYYKYPKQDLIIN